MKLWCRCRSLKSYSIFPRSMYTAIKGMYIYTERVCMYWVRRRSRRDDNFDDDDVVVDDGDNDDVDNDDGMREG